MGLCARLLGVTAIGLDRGNRCCERTDGADAGPACAGRRHSGPFRRRRRRISRHSLCEASGRRPALAAAAAGGAMGRDAAGDEVRQHLRAAATRRVRGAEQDRGLSLSQRIHAGRRARGRRAASGDGVVSRRRSVFRRKQRLRRVQAREPRPSGGGDAQLPRRRAGLPLASRDQCRRPPLRELRDHGRAVRAALGADEHRRVRRRSRQRHDLRAIRRRHRCDGQSRFAAFEGSFPPGDQPEWNAHWRHAAGDSPQARRGIRRDGRMRRPEPAVPARAVGRSGARASRRHSRRRPRLSVDRRHASSPALRSMLSRAGSSTACRS